MIENVLIACGVIVSAPFCMYIIARIISKAWHKSKNEENTYHG